MKFPLAEKGRRLSRGSRLKKVSLGRRARLDRVNGPLDVGEETLQFLPALALPLCS